MDEEILIPARMVNEYTYCPRLCYIEWVQGEFEDSADTVEGRYEHRNVDKEGSAWLDDVRKAVRSVTLSAPTSRLIGKIDLLEIEGLEAIPVDYKKGRAPDNPEGSHEADRLQLAALAAILRENGYECVKGCIYYVGSRRRVDVPMTEELMTRLGQVVDAMMILKGAGEPPPPLKESPKCPRCSLVSLCLPDETNLLRGEGGEVRRLVPARDDLLPVYVTMEGAIVRKREGRLEVTQSGEKIVDVPLHDVSQVSLYGSSSMTAPAISELLQRGIPICHFTHGGWFLGVTTGCFSNNAGLQLAQYKAAIDDSRALALAKSFVEGKIRNSRTMIRRNDKEVPEELLDQMARLARCVKNASSPEELLGIEGSAAQLYFQRFGGMLKMPMRLEFEHRTKRPPKGPVNAVLSYLYGVMVKDWYVTLMTVGFNPLIGFYHRPRHGKPSLALDMMEEFRPIVADSVCITLFNNGELREDDFVVTAQGTSMSSDARKRVIRAYERRLDSEITHPIFGYTISYRRAFEVQARLLARAITEEISDYPSFTTR